MPTIKPFQGIFYNSKKIKDLSSVLAPPYDVIDEKERERLYEISPYNAARLILPQGPGKYERAARDFRSWLKEGILTFYQESSLYLLEEEFEFQGKRKVRKGFFALVSIKESGKGKVFAHETTLPGPKEDRMCLIQATRANLSPVLALYPAEVPLTSLLEAACDREKILISTEAQGVKMRLWPIRSKVAIEKISRLLAGSPLLIADGHHRYEAASAFAHLKPRSAGEDGSRDYVLMLCVSSSDPGVIILPVHRLVRGLAKPQAHQSVIYRVARALGIHLIEHLDDDPALILEAIASRKEVALALYFGKPPKTYLLTSHKKSISPLEVASGLEEAVFSRFFSKKQRERGELAYEPWASSAVRKVREGEYELAFILKAPLVEEIWEVARCGERLPPKSTYFYPKIKSGIILRSINHGNTEYY